MFDGISIWTDGVGASRTSDDILSVGAEMPVILVAVLEALRSAHIALRTVKALRLQRVRLVLIGQLTLILHRAS